MKKSNKILAIIAGLAILFGLACSGIIIVQGIRTGAFPVTASANNRRYPSAWDLEKTKLDEFSDISITLSYCDLSILPADGYYLEYHMDGICKEPAYDVSGGSFRFQEGATQEKYRGNFHFFFNPKSFYSSRESYYVNLYVPKEQYFSLLTIESDSGNIEIGDIQAEQADITAEYGNLDADSFSGKKLSIETDSGNITLGTVTCDTLEISNEYGNISADSFEIAQNAAIHLDSGNLELSRLTSEQLTLSNEYGNCTINETNAANSSITMDSGALNLYKATLGDTDIHNEYGDITLILANEVSDYNYDLKAEYGSVKVDGKNMGADDDGETYYQKDNGKKDNICITCESGNIDIH